MRIFICASLSNLGLPFFYRSSICPRAPVCFGVLFRVKMAIHLLRKGGSISSFRLHTRSLSSKFDVDTFTSDFLKEIGGVVKATDPAQSSEVLRKLVKSNTLSYFDMSDCPEKFFLAHRLLSSVGLGGFGIRFTVQFNLFAGKKYVYIYPYYFYTSHNIIKSKNLFRRFYSWTGRY